MMPGFRLAAQKPPEAQRVNEVVVSRYEHVYEVDPPTCCTVSYPRRVVNRDISLVPGAMAVRVARSPSLRVMRDAARAGANRHGRPVFGLSRGLNPGVCRSLLDTDLTQAPTIGRRL